MKETLIQVLEQAGFTESGTDQYVHPHHGRIFTNGDFQPSELVHKLMNLGAQHQANKLRDALMLERQTECYIFNPQA